MRVAAVQMTSTEEVPGNLAEARRLVREAAAAGAELIGLPENFAYLGADGDHRLSIAEVIDGAGGGAAPILDSMRELARAVGRHLLLGGFPERSARGDRIHNTAILLDPAGEV